MADYKQTSLEWIGARTEELAYLLSQPSVLADQEKWKNYTKEYNRLLPIAELVKERKKVEAEQDGLQALASDEDMADAVLEETENLSRRKQQLEDKIKELMSSAAEQNDEKAIMEIRAGAGGEEAALFAAMLTRMYTRYAEGKGWAVELLSVSDTELGGVKESVFSVTGKEVLQHLQNESGVHRIQRIPVTDSNGKRQSSTATVAVLREASDVELQISPEDIRTDLYRATGHGGQHINKTDSAVRLTHLPTGIVVTCQDERSQLRNKEKAMEILRARLYDRLHTEMQTEYADGRKNQVGTGDRSERVRTYNFNDGRITDHRIGKTVYNVDEFINGKMDEIIDALIEKSEADAVSAAMK